MTDDGAANAPARARPALLDAATGAGVEDADPLVITDEAAPATGRGHCDFALALTKVRKTNVSTSLVGIGHGRRRDRLATCEDCPRRREARLFVDSERTLPAASEPETDVWRWSR